MIMPQGCQCDVYVDAHYGVGTWAHKIGVGEGTVLTLITRAWQLSDSRLCSCIVFPQTLVLLVELQGS